MKSVRLTDARLSELIETLAATGDVYILRGDEPVARLTSPNGKPSLRDLQPTSVGALLRPVFQPDDDLLDEMITR